MKITRKQLRKIISEAITASDKGVVDFPPEDRVARLPSGTAMKKSAMPDMIKDLLDSEDDDFVTQGYELSDSLYGFEDGATKKALDVDAQSFVRAALGEDYKALSKGNLRRLSRLVGKKVFSSNGFYVWSNPNMTNTTPSTDANKGEELLNSDQVNDIIDELQEFGKYKTYEAAEDRVYDVVTRLVGVLCVANWELGTWVGPDGFVNHGTEIVGYSTGSLGEQRTHNKYNIELLNPEYKRLRDIGKFIIAADFQIFQEIK